MTEKTCFLSVRMTCAERAHLNQMAKKSGLSLSNTIRACINGTEIRERQTPEIRQLYTEINRIGTNINQIARRINGGIGTEEDVSRALYLLQKVYEQMERIADL